MTSWAAPTEPAILSIAGATYPVFFTYGQEDKSLQVTIVCAATSTEFTTTLPATTVDILASAAKCDAASQAFRAFVLDHVRLRVDGRTRAFFLGHTRFHDRHFDAGRLADAEQGVGKRLVRQFGDVVRSLADQRTLQERIVWSNQQLMDTLTKGFEHMHELAARFVQHDAVVTQLVADVQQWRRLDMERYRDWMELQQHDHRIVEELEERLHMVSDQLGGHVRCFRDVAQGPAPRRRDVVGPSTPRAGRRDQGDAATS
ncbi:hypothetical protein, variant [Saprolegnia diclina VS20]|uniref:Uncharacterized protein n=1 Tax=Saprolegnia diclina (strain VS20) TaxID=1156394 RepID=T0QFF9_SAPDV|nr:hypothetical protein, variant [Saprolegnia diclina VS20]EQC36679.1 hypothetical protein, variant [Saprolegnia diclina VS20]|eukprot:XP_008610099.1 hypothetical protein, variant [Saprolegnia diclina VS20]